MWKAQQNILYCLGVFFVRACCSISQKYGFKVFIFIWNNFGIDFIIIGILSISLRFPTSYDSMPPRMCFNMLFFITSSLVFSAKSSISDNYSPICWMSNYYSSSLLEEETSIDRGMVTTMWGAASKHFASLNCNHWLEAPNSVTKACIVHECGSKSDGYCRMKVYTTELVQQVLVLVFQRAGLRFFVLNQFLGQNTSDFTSFSLTEGQ